MSSISSNSSSDLVEYHKIHLWDGDTAWKVEEMYKKLLPPYEEVYRQMTKGMDEVVKSRPTVQPLVRRRRAFQPPSDPNSGKAVVPSGSCEFSQIKTRMAVPETLLAEAPETPSAEASETPSSKAPESTSTEKSPSTCRTKHTSHRTTARKSKTSKIAKAKSSTSTKKQKKCKNYRTVLINLKHSNLSKYVKPLLRRYKEGEMKSSTDQRKDSVDSGVATDDEIGGSPISPMKIQLNFGGRLPRSEPNMRVEKRVAPPSASYLSKKSTNETKPRKPSSREAIDSYAGGATPISEPTRRRLRKRALPSMTERPIPSIPVSVPLTDLMRLEVPDAQSRYLGNFDDENVTYKTVLPKDVIPTVEFEVANLEMSPLAKKRYKDPPPLMFFPPYDGRKSICISCNKRFKCKQDLASHVLANHHTFNY